jgi:hypothetical protein
MSWNVPRTWITSEVVTAAMMNSHVRDNFLETAAATANAAGDIVYADEANSMGSKLAMGAPPAHLSHDGSDLVWRRPATDSRSDAVAGGAAGFYRSLGGVNWYNDANEVTVSLTTGTNVLLFIKGMMSNDTAAATTIIGYTVGGATTVTATSTRAIHYKSAAAGDQSPMMGAAFWHGGLTAGTNVFTLVAYVSSTSGTISNPALIVVPF